MSGLGLLRLKLGNGYRNWRYGTRSEPSTKWGIALGVLLPRFRSGSDFSYRYLPKTCSKLPKVLDLGCGGGQWLSRIGDTGWQRFGADPDPRAASLARERGIEVRQGGIEAWSDAVGQFDALTMSHVIEHVHDPRRVLSGARDLLRPGGQLFIETPNIDALGHWFFGRAWRGLEAPRHLVLFNLKSLTLLLKQAGFERIRVRPAPSQLDFILAVSGGLASIEPDLSDVPQRSSLDEHWLRVRARFSGSRSEFLTLTCSRAR
jgi:SAM-dependent methyltransferase